MRKIEAVVEVNFLADSERQENDFKECLCLTLDVSQLPLFQRWVRHLQGRSTENVMDPLVTVAGHIASKHQINLG